MIAFKTPKLILICSVNYNECGIVYLVSSKLEIPPPFSLGAGLKKKGAIVQIHVKDFFYFHLRRFLHMWLGDLRFQKLGQLRAFYTYCLRTGTQLIVFFTPSLRNYL